MLMCIRISCLKLHGLCRKRCHTLQKFRNQATCIESAATQDTILALDGTKNTRYLGIYKDIGGNSLNQKAFLRSDNTNNLSKNDLKKLKELNVKTVIDLRYPNETAKTPDKFKDVEWVKYHNITVAINRKYSLYDRYIKALECKKLIKNIFETIANAKEGTILFHCTYGKDRTGILSMLLLGIADVKNEDIVENYLDCYLFDCSAENYDKEYGKNKENIEKVINYIIYKYGSFDNYILSTGLSEENLYRVKQSINPNIVKPNSGFVNTTQNYELATYLSNNCYNVGPTESDLEKYQLFISGEYHASKKNHEVQKAIIICAKRSI